MKLGAPFHVAVGVLAVAQFLFVAAFVGAERTIYFWDYAMYHNMALNLRYALGVGFAEGWAQFRASLGQDYNLIFALPAQIGFTLFGEGRSVFVLTNFVAFFLPFEIAVAFVVRRVFLLGWPMALVAAFGGCSLIPALWRPLLDGFPDVASAALITFALGLALERPKSWRVALGLGVLVGLAVLLRRHFAYAGLALLVVMTVFDSVDALRTRGAESLGRVLRRLTARLFLSGFAALAVLALVMPDYLLQMLSVNFNALYASYQSPAADFFAFIVEAWGLLLLGATVAGWAVAAALFPPLRSALAFVGAYTAVWLLAWGFASRQVEYHYMLPALPLATVLGLTGLVLGVQRIAPRWRVALLGAGVLVLGGNAVWALWLAPRDQVLPPVTQDWGIFSAPRPPMERLDIEALAALTRHLAASVKPDDRIVLVGSSRVVNQDLLRTVFLQLGARDLAARLLMAPEVDSREGPPLNAFAAASVYIVPEPAQYHLDPSGQKVVTALAERFPPQGASAPLFRRDDAVFTLANGVRASVWRRDPWTPGVLHDQLTAIRRVAGGAEAWVESLAPRSLNLASTTDGKAFALAAFDRDNATLELFFDAPLTAGSHRLAEDVEAEPSCRNRRFTLILATARGRVLRQEPFAPIVLPGALVRHFDVATGEDAFLKLRLTVESATTQGCRVALRNLRVERQ